MTQSHKSRMIHYKDYVAGWLDSSIPEFLAEFAPAPRSMQVTLVTSLDSDLSPKKLLADSPELKPLLPVSKELGEGFTVPTSSVMGAASGIFHGFDEVWFFPNADITPKPKSAWLVGPNRIDQAKLDKLGTWMASNQCSLALGDGDGLNFIVKARGLVKYILAHSLSQPQPEAGGVEETLIAGMSGRG